MCNRQFYFIVPGAKDCFHIDHFYTSLVQMLCSCSLDLCLYLSLCCHVFRIVCATIRSGIDAHTSAPSICYCSIHTIPGSHQPLLMFCPKQKPRKQIAAHQKCPTAERYATTHRHTRWRGWQEVHFVTAASFFFFRPMNGDKLRPIYAPANKWLCPSAPHPHHSQQQPKTHTNILV